jgi:hypothetical protein
MGVGTINGEVILADWEANRVVGRATLPGAVTMHREPYVDSATTSRMAISGDRS